MSEQLLKHLQIQKGDVGRYCITPGDPGRVAKIAAYLDNPVQIADNREYLTMNGTLEGELVTVTSTGIGGPSCAIAIEELVMAGADTFIRVGTSGYMQPFIEGGDVVIATGAIRKEGVTREYMPIEFPAVPTLSVVNALCGAAEALGARYHAGIVESKDSFYGKVSPERMPVGRELQFKWDAWVKGGALTSEMECAATFIVGSVLGVRTGAVLYIVPSQERLKEGLTIAFDTEIAVKVAVEAIRKIIQSDKAAGK